MLFLLLPLRQNLHRLRITFTLKDANCNILALTPIQLAVYTYDAGNPLNASWMVLEQKAVPVTDINGLVSVGYGGPGAAGDTVYVAVFVPGSPTPASLIWTTLVT